MRSWPEGGRPPEPVLAVGDIQGNVLPGFGSPYQALLFLEVLSPDPAAAWLRSQPITTMADVLWAREGRGHPRLMASGHWTNLALSYRGLGKLRRDADQLTDLPFKQGMDRRSALLGDPTSPDAAGSCRNWVVGGPGRRGFDIMVLLAADEPAELSAAVDKLRRNPPSGLRIVFEQQGAELPAPMTGREPFGFCDNISQPGVRGRLSQGQGDFLTPRENPNDPDQGRPGQNLVWPGEFVFGYPGQDPLDTSRPGLLANGGPSWTRNGSLLVVRRLRQDVAGFHAFLQSASADLATRHPMLSGLTPERLGAKLMGRWASGAPVMTCPDADRPAVGRDTRVNNDFTYLAAAGGSGDPLGLRCPRAAHIRRAYPRDAATSRLTKATIETHRLLRRSIPFTEAAQPSPERGLLFLAYQTSIERQFEFVSRAWLNNPHVHDTNDGHDPIAGQSFGVGGDRARSFSIAVGSPEVGIGQVALSLPTDWVVPTGGGYLLVPSVSALRTLG